MNVTVYSTPTCPYCKQAKKFLKENSIAFTDVDVSEDQDKQQEMIEKSGQMGVPVIIVKKDGKEEVMIGFEKGKLSAAVGI